MSTTEARPRVVKASLVHVRLVTDLWAPFAIYCRAKDPKWGWRWFMWDQIIPHLPTWAAMHEGHLEGLIAYEVIDDAGTKVLKVYFLASAPWNVPPVRKLTGVGAGLLARAARDAQAAQVDLLLSSTPESEDFYEKKMKMVRTGGKDQEGLAIFRLPLASIAQFLGSYSPLEDAQ